MKKKIIIGSVIALGLVLATLLALLIAQDMKQKKALEEKEALKKAFGFHIVDDKVYANFYGACIIFDRNGQATVSSLSFQGAEGENGAFEGDLAVLGFEPEEEGYITYNPVVQRWDNGIYTVFDRPDCRHNEPDEDGLSTWITHPTRYSLTYLMREDDPKFLAVQIYDEDEYTYHVAILAETEEEARAGWKWFDENRPDGLT